ncbi:hypothetical protein A3F37_03465 [Candidatus Saccharibacteria bacterium RIFCSPHIGHO2_12_FULL_41_12]|nr:MAG: hypothetical protein A3F37_03465 [Candidatus Saccharibacteria bacterium RIFCSPHIGHO2_12_FULL_41_12]
MFLVVGVIIGLDIKPVFGLSEKQKQIYDSGIYYYDVDICDNTAVSDNEESSGTTSGEDREYKKAGNIPEAGRDAQATVYGTNGNKDKDGKYIEYLGGIEGGSKDETGRALKGQTALAEMHGNSALGGLPYGTKIEVTYKNKSIVAKVVDNGPAGASDIDVWRQTADLLELPYGNTKVKIRAVSKSTPVTPVSGSASSDESPNEGISQGAQCCPSSGYTTGSVSGKDNREKVFNFFVSIGYKPFQAAAIVGNMMAESGVEPKKSEGIYNRKVSADEFLSGVGGPGWGIVQWTNGRKFINPTKQARKDPNKIEVQLRFLANQLAGKGPIPEKAAGDDLKKTTTIREAVLAFQGDTQAGGKHPGYERPGDQAGSVPERLRQAKKALTEFGSNGGGVAEASSEVTSTGTCAGGDSESNGATGEFSLPVDKKYFTQNKIWFTKPHHTYPASDIPVGSGTKIFAVGKGTVASMANSGWGGGAGTSVFVKDGDILYGYFHGTPGSVKVKVGDKIEAGQLLMLSDNTGNSRGPHLHFDLEYKGQKKCPQSLLKAIGEGKPVPSVKSLPGSGCVG